MAVIMDLVLILAWSAIVITDSDLGSLLLAVSIRSPQSGWIWGFPLQLDKRRQLVCS
jgi:hypothetical protein